MSELRLDIDLNRLEREAVLQPRLRLEWGEKLTDAHAGVEEAKARMSIADAELESEIRAEPLDYGIEKFTEGAVKATIAADPRHQAAEKKVRVASKSLGYIKAAVEAIDQRKRMIEKLVDLHGQEYWSTPYISSPDIKEDADDQMKAEVRSRGQRRRRRKVNDEA